MKIRALLLSTLLLLGLSALARADITAGLAAYTAGDYATGLGELEPLAEAGDAEAQYYVGLIHLHGQGRFKDDALAFQWFQKASEQEHGYAQFALALMYMDGRGVERNYGEANYWLELALLNGVHLAKQYLPDSGGI